MTFKNNYRNIKIENAAGGAKLPPPQGRVKGTKKKLDKNIREITLLPLFAS